MFWFIFFLPSSPHPFLSSSSPISASSCVSPFPSSYHLLHLFLFHLLNHLLFYFANVFFFSTYFLPIFIFLYSIFLFIMFFSVCIFFIFSTSSSFLLSSSYISHLRLLCYFCHHLPLHMCTQNWSILLTLIQSDITVVCASVVSTPTV